MTDDQIIKKCAEAMGMRPAHDGFDPLFNGRDTMDMIERLRIHLDSASIIEADQVLWRASTPCLGDVSERDFDPRRAACLLAAKLA